MISLFWFVFGVAVGWISLIAWVSWNMGGLPEGE